MERGNFGTKIGVILATAGSAVGLGNIWCFPYMTGENGGAAFILIYLCCVLFFGIPGMVAEFIVGRNGASNAVRAYAKLSGCKGWSAVGVVGVFTSMVILGFYAVVAGWCCQYMFASFGGMLNGDAEYVKEYFVNFSSNPWKPMFWTVAFIFITHLVVVRGVKDGIEKVSKLLMPMLFVLLIVIAVASCSLPGMEKGLEFLFKPDFDKINSSSLLGALGQAFFSLSLGTACLCTYASYFKKSQNLAKSAFYIAGIDTLVAVLAGLMIFPAAFAVGVSPDSGPSLVFITLPNVFSQAFSSVPVVGVVISVMFYTLLVLAALTSTISMHEIGTAFFHEEMKITRRSAAWMTTIVCCAIGVVCSLSNGAVTGLELFGMSVQDFCDYLTAQVLLPLGSLFTCLLVGWFSPIAVVRDEFTNNGTVSRSLFNVYLFAVRFICPICIISIFLHQFKIF